MPFKNILTFRERHIEYLKPEILALLDQEEKITYKEYEELRMNSYERQLIIPRLDNEALIKITKHHLKNCRPMEKLIATTYDESIIHILTPLLIERLQQLITNNTNKSGSYNCI